jgi:hypothetical protein
MGAVTGVYGAMVDIGLAGENLGKTSFSTAASQVI